MKKRRHKIVLCNGVWDVLHYGHLLHLEAAAKMGDMLVVSITDDAHVNKGPGRPVYPDSQRAALVMALKCVDDIVVVSSLLDALEIVKPDILVKGIDYRNGLEERHERYCKEHGIEIRYTDTPKLSAAEMIDEARSRRRA